MLFNLSDTVPARTVPAGRVRTAGRLGLHGALHMVWCLLLRFARVQRRIHRGHLLVACHSSWRAAGWRLRGARKALGDHRRAGRHVRQQRRVQTTLHLRRAGLLLAALGDTPEQVEATLTRHWQQTGDDDPLELIESWLAARLTKLEPSLCWHIHVEPWMTTIGTRHLPTPAPVRRYLPHAAAHQRRLAAAATGRA